MSSHQTTPPTRSIRAEMRTSADPRRVWDAWADPKRIAEWFTDAAEGSATMGSTFTWIFEKFGYRIPYTVVAAIPGERWTLQWEGMPGRPPGVIDVVITREGGDTVVRLVNSGFLEGAEWDDEYQGVDSGWRMALAMLKTYVEEHYGRSKQTALVMRPASYSYDGLRPYYRDAVLLARWLTQRGEVGPVGEPCALTLRDGGPLTGRVLARTDTELSLEWSEVGGVLELKAFAMGKGNRAICLRATSWERDAEWKRVTEGWFTHALDRLSAELEPAEAPAAAR